MTTLRPEELRMDVPVIRKWMDPLVGLFVGEIAPIY